jgi:hypothetical protein
VPGDWNATGASQAIGASINTGGDDSGQIDNGTTATTAYIEPNAMWVQMASAGFIQGSYTAGATGSGVAATAVPTNANGVAPLDAFNNVMLLGRTDSFAGAPSARLHLIVGCGIPVDVMANWTRKSIMVRQTPVICAPCPQRLAVPAGLVPSPNKTIFV